MAAQTFAGSRARFKINGEKVGFAAGISGEESIDYEPVDVLDLINTLEHVPVGYRCNFNAQMFRVVGQSLKNLGIFPLESNILTSGDLEASIEDTVAGRTAYLFTGVKATTKSFDINARGLVSEQVGFTAIRVKDESEV